MIPRNEVQDLTEFERGYGGKPWSYLLIPHDALAVSCTMEGFVHQFGRS